MKMFLISFDTDNLALITKSKMQITNNNHSNDATIPNLIPKVIWLFMQISEVPLFSTQLNSTNKTED